MPPLSVVGLKKRTRVREINIHLRNTTRRRPCVLASGRDTRRKKAATKITKVRRDRCRLSLQHINVNRKAGYFSKNFWRESTIALEWSPLSLQVEWSPMVSLNQSWIGRCALKLLCAGRPPQQLSHSWTVQANVANAVLASRATNFLSFCLGSRLFFSRN